MTVPFRRFLLSCLFTGLGSAAFAAPGLTTADVHMRSGPGVSSSVVTVVPGGSNVQVFDCGGGWCEASWRRYRGYISDNYLDVGRGGPVPAYGYAPPPPPVAFGPPVVYGPGPYFGPHYGYRYGWGWRHRYWGW